MSSRGRLTPSALGIGKQEDGHAYNSAPFRSGGQGQMKILLSSIGSRGDVQPLIALALELRALGHNPSLCVAPNFKEWVESFGLTCIPIGPDLRKLGGGLAPSMLVKSSKAQLQQLAVRTVRDQFQTLTAAARGFDLLVAWGTLQITTRSVAESLGIPYVFVALGPVMLPAPDYPPPKVGSHYSQSLPGLVNRFLWMRDEQGWNERFGATLNEERAKAGLAPVRSVLRHILTDRPLLAADPALAPASAATGLQIVQTGAWFLPDQTALPEQVEQFLANGEPPIYFGFGSTMRAAEQTGQVLLETARALRRRAIISQGWANLRSNDAGPDCLSIGDVNFEKLLRRVAAVVHHGGAGTTAAAARAGKPQVIVPHRYDQYYWAHRVQRSGVGVSGPTPEHLTGPALVSALRACLQPEMAARAEALARRIEPHGAQKAAEWLVHEFG